MTEFRCLSATPILRRLEIIGICQQQPHCLFGNTDFLMAPFYIRGRISNATADAIWRFSRNRNEILDGFDWRSQFSLGERYFSGASGHADSILFQNRNLRFIASRANQAWDAMFEAALLTRESLFLTRALTFGNRLFARYSKQHSLGQRQ